MASLSNSYDGIGSLYNTYAVSSNSALQSYNESINAALAEDTSYNKIANCKITFANLGKLDFDFLSVSSTPLNMKLFNKIAKIDQNMRRINDIFIQLIVNMNCCFLAGKYNSAIRKPMQDITQNFCNALVSIAEQAAKSYVIFKTYLCLVKPVSGNPWLKQGGYDWMKTIYSFMYGFEAFFDWIMDGTILNIILDPMETFIKKLQSCAPILDSDDPEFKIYLLAYQKMLLENQMNTINEYTSTVTATETGTEVVTKGIEKDPLVGEIIKLKKQYFSNDTRLETLKYELETLYTSGSKNVILTEEYNQLIAEQESLLIKIKDKAIVLNKKYSDQTVVNPREKQFLKDMAALQDQYYISQSEYNNVLLLKNKVSCNCLLTILGVSFNTAEYFELSQSKQVNDLVGRVLYSNKDTYKKALEDLDSHKIVDKSSFLINNIGDIDSVSFDQEEIANLKRIVAYGHSLDNTKFSFIVPDINSSTAQLGGVGTSEGMFDLDTNKYTVETSTGTLDFNVFDNNVLSQKDLFKIQVKEGFTPSAVIELNSRRLNLIKNINSAKTKHDINARNEENKLQAAYSEIYKIYKTEANTLDVLEISGVGDFTKALNARAKMNQMGNYFDALPFIEFLIQWGSDIETDINKLKQKDLLTSTKYVLDNYTTVSRVDDTKWYLYTVSKNIHKGAIKKLELLLEYEHISIELISEGSDIPCGCDIICKIIQWLIDLIISAINGLIKAIIARLVSSLMNENLAYIIKFILAKLQCVKDIMAISKKLDTIKKRADNLSAQLKIEYNKMPDPMYCDAGNGDDLSSRLAVSEIPYKSFVQNVNETPYQIPTTNFGNVPDDVIYNEVNVSNDIIIKEQVKNAYIPTLYFDCKDGKNPYIELNTPSLQSANTYEMNIIFKIGEFINQAPVTSTTLSATNVVSDIILDDGTTVVLPSSSITDESITAALAEVEKRLEEIQKTDLYIQSSCKTTSSYLEFCSLNDLKVSSIKFANTGSTGVIEEDSTIYGSLLTSYISTAPLKVYYPEHTEADSNGYYYLPIGSVYYDYKIPKAVEYIIDDTITTEIIETIYNNGTFTTHDIVRTRSNLDLTTKIQYMIIDEQTITEEYSNWTQIFASDGSIINDSYGRAIGKVDLKRTIKHNAKKYFTRTNLEFVANFTNKVNNVDVRAILDINLDPSTSTPQYIPGGYLGRYPNYIYLGETASSTNLDNDEFSHYYISKDRMAILSKDILKDNYLISQSLAEQIKKTSSTVAQKEAEQSNCLLTSDQQQSLANTTVASELLTTTMTDMINSINNAVPNLTLDDILNDPSVTNGLDSTDISTKVDNSIMFLMLNYKYGIAVQIVNKKLVLHIPSSTTLNASKVVIDYELQPDNMYNFTYAVQGRQITISLLDESKIIYTASVLNIYGYDLIPEYIGGTPPGLMPTGMKTACTLQVYNISYSDIGTAKDYYKNTVLNTIPRTSVVTFDYSVTDVTNRIYNIAATTNVTTLNNANIINLLGVSKEKQRISGYGKVVSNGFFQAYKGMLDNFFCSSNLSDFSYTLSVWFYVDKTNSKNSRHVIINDDINNNIIYYNGVNNTLNIEFANAQKEVIQGLEDKWYCLFIEKYEYEKKYRVILTSKNFANRIEKIINTPIKFNLMSIGAEYIKGLNYTNLFEGLFGPISVYIGPNTDSEKVITCGNQYLQIKGIETIVEETL